MLRANSPGRTTKSNLNFLKHAAGACSVSGVSTSTLRGRSDLDVDDCQPSSLDQLSGAGVSFERGDRGEHRARQQHGVAALPLWVARTTIAPRGHEGGNQPVEIGRRDVRHVAEHDQGAGRLVRQPAMPALSELARPLAKSGLSTTSHIEPESAAPNAVRLMSRDHHRAGGPTGHHALHHAADQRLAAEQAPGACWDRPSCLIGRPPELRREPADWLQCGRASRGCGRVGISISSPPTPMPAMSASDTSMPAISRSSTQSKPFSFGLRAQPGAPSTGFSP